MQIPASGAGLCAFLREIESNVEPGFDIHVVLDNLYAHRAPPVQRWLRPSSPTWTHITPATRR